MKYNNDDTIGNDRILNAIFTVRGKKVIIDKHLSEFLKFDLQEIRGKIGALKNEFPTNSVYILQPKEIEFLCSKNLISESESVETVYAITEEGVLSLGNTIGSENVLVVSNQIVHVFSLVRKMLSNLEKLKNNLGLVKDKLEKIHKKDPDQATTIKNKEPNLLGSDFTINSKYSDRFKVRFEMPDC